MNTSKDEKLKDMAFMKNLQCCFTCGAGAIANCEDCNGYFCDNCSYYHIQKGETCQKAAKFFKN